MPLQRIALFYFVTCSQNRYAAVFEDSVFFWPVVNGSEVAAESHFGVAHFCAIFSFGEEEVDLSDDERQAAVTFNQ